MKSEPKVFWITGLPAAGKTTLALALTESLTTVARAAFVLDGDELRKGLCADLGHSEADRSENIRRAGEVARLMTKAGVDVVCAFVSPFERDRQRARALFQPGQFVEVYLSTPLTECMRRDPKGLYGRAKAGKIHGLTGWDGSYEPPSAPELTFNTEVTDVSQMVAALRCHCGLITDPHHSQ